MTRILLFVALVAVLVLSLGALASAAPSAASGPSVATHSASVTEQAQLRLVAAGLPEKEAGKRLQVLAQAEIQKIATGEQPVQVAAASNVNVSTETLLIAAVLLILILR